MNPFGKKYLMLLNLLHMFMVQNLRIDISRLYSIFKTLSTVFHYCPCTLRFFIPVLNNGKCLLFGFIITCPHSFWITQLYYYIIVNLFMSLFSSHYCGLLEGKGYVIYLSFIAFLWKFHNLFLISSMENKKKHSPTWSLVIVGKARDIRAWKKLRASF